MPPENRKRVKAFSSVCIGGKNLSHIYSGSVQVEDFSIIVKLHLFPYVL
jgi:hypothetical protein